MRNNLIFYLLPLDKPVICGGGGDGSGTGSANPDCYMFDQTSWKFLVNLGTQRREASSVVLWDELWVRFLMIPNVNILIRDHSFRTSAFVRGQGA